MNRKTYQAENLAVLLYAIMSPGIHSVNNILQDLNKNIFLLLIDLPRVFFITSNVEKGGNISRFPMWFRPVREGIERKRLLIRDHIPCGTRLLQHRLPDKGFDIFLTVITAIIVDGYHLPQVLGG